MSTRVSSAKARERIVGAAERLLRDRPYRDLGVDQVMAEAGLSRTVFYRHFDGLAAVVLALLGQITDELRDTLVSQEMEDILAAAVQMFARHGPFLRAVMEAASHDAEIEAAYEAMVARFTAIMTGQFEQGIREGRVAPGDPGELARAMNLMNIHYLLDTLGRDPGFDRRLAYETLLAVWVPLTSHGPDPPPRPLSRRAL